MVTLLSILITIPDNKKAAKKRHDEREQDPNIMCVYTDDSGIRGWCEVYTLKKNLIVKVGIWGKSGFEFEESWDFETRLLNFLADDLSSNNNFLIHMRSI